MKSDLENSLACKIQLEMNSKTSLSNNHQRIRNGTCQYKTYKDIKITENKTFTIPEYAANLVFSIPVIIETIERNDNDYLKIEFISQILP